MWLNGFTYRLKFQGVNFTVLCKISFIKSKEKKLLRLQKFQLVLGRKAHKMDPCPPAVNSNTMVK